jgi:hypothetical protein
MLATPAGGLHVPKMISSLIRARTQRPVRRRLPAPGGEQHPRWRRDGDAPVVAGADFGASRRRERLALGLRLKVVRCTRAALLPKLPWPVGPDRATRLATHETSRRTARRWERLGPELGPSDEVLSPLPPLHPGAGATGAGFSAPLERRNAMPGQRTAMCRSLDASIPPNAPGKPASGGEREPCARTPSGVRSIRPMSGRVRPLQRAKSKREDRTIANRRGGMPQSAPEESS